jgi:hypothetical protein
MMPICLILDVTSNLPFFVHQPVINFLRFPIEKQSLGVMLP